MDDTLQDICSFCAEIEKRPDHNLFHEVIGSSIKYRYILYETDNFCVMPSLGSLMSGYLLVVPKEHVLSFGWLPPDVDDELRTLLNKVASWLKENYDSECIFFEHGSVSFTNRGGSCTDHAHLHVVPVPEVVNLVDVMRRDFQTRPITSIAELRDQIERDAAYLFLRHHDGSMYVCDAPDAKSQHLRRDLVKQLGLDEIWDWSIFPGEEHIIATIEQSEKNPLSGVTNE